MADVGDKLTVFIGPRAALEGVYSEEPTANLRWNNGILEQEFVINKYPTGINRSEWRPIPTIGDK